MRNIKIVFQCIGAVFFVALLSFGVFGTYLERNPEKAAAYALGSMTVDPNASYYDQAMQMIRGYTTASGAMDDASEQLAEMQELQDEGFERRSTEFMEDRYGSPGDSGGDESSYDSSAEPFSDSSDEGE